MQNHRVQDDLLPMFALTFEQAEGELQSTKTFDHQVDALNQLYPSHPIHINNQRTILTDEASTGYFDYIDMLSKAIDQSKTTGEAMFNLLYRAIAYAMIQNYEGAIDDLSTYLQIDSTSTIALWQRAVCQSRINDFQASEGTNIELKTANVMGDLNHALTLSPANPYIIYNRATLYAQRQDYQQAIRDYTEVLRIDPNIAEAYYNRGLCHLRLDHRDAAIHDLSKAGELGLYGAYSIMKKI